MKPQETPGESSAIELTVNGAPRPLEVDACTTLLDALRDRLHLTGTKRGCHLGQCGACTVLLDGRRINACLTLAVIADDGNMQREYPVLVGVAPAIANAVYHATGRRVRNLPITPEKLLG